MLPKKAESKCPKILLIFELIKKSMKLRHSTRNQILSLTKINLFGYFLYELAKIDDIDFILVKCKPIKK